MWTLIITSAITFIFGTLGGWFAYKATEDISYQDDPEDCYK